MHDGAERIDLLTLNENVNLHQIGGLFAVLMVVKRRVTLGSALQLVEEVEHDFGQWNTIMHFHTVGGNVLHGAHLATMVLAQVHDGADEFLRSDDVGGNHRFDDLLDLAVGEFTRISHTIHGIVFRSDLVRHVRRGGDQIKIEFAAQSFGHDLHMQQAKEAAAEAKA